MNSFIQCMNIAPNIIYQCKICDRLYNNSGVNYLSAWAESALIVGIQCSNTLN